MYYTTMCNAKRAAKAAVVTPVAATMATNAAKSATTPAKTSVAAVENTAHQRTAAQAKANANTLPNTGNNGKTSILAALAMGVSGC